jgi:hypothetical protein
MELGGRTFTFQRASDANRDGMYFEAWEGDRQVADVFYSDATRKSTFTAFEKDLPVQLVQYMVTEGLAQITPVDDLKAPIPEC